MTFRNPDLKESYSRLMGAKQNMRPQELIIEELKEMLRPLGEREFLTHVMSVLCSCGDRESWLFDNLASPMKQMLYLIDVYYSIEKRGEQGALNRALWGKITKLLDEIELNYFVSMGFMNNGDVFHDSRDEKVAVSLMTYFNHFSNAQLTYDEQTLWRIENYFRPYDKYIIEAFGFCIDNALDYINYLSDLYNAKLTESLRGASDIYTYFSKNPHEWTALTTNWINQGIKPEDWILQPELKGMYNWSKTPPGECFICDIDALYSETYSSEVNRCLIDFFKYPLADVSGNQSVYYGSERIYADSPLILMESEAVVPYMKFLYEALYCRIDSYLSKQPGISVKYKQSKDSKLEDKVYELFRAIFKDEAHYYRSYSVDGKCEQDLLVEYKGNYFIIEVKDCNFREPMRDALKAYDKIKKDFSVAVQKGYEQCRRVEDALSGDRPIRLTDGKTFRRDLYTISPARVKNVYSIIVTQHKYGPIQTDLSNLLTVDEEHPYPWSVCVDDLEAFILLLRKKFRNGARRRFVQYIEAREAFHEHLMCFDELELCGYFICQPTQFEKLAESDTVVYTFAGMSDIFDAYYHIGLGFKNEIHADIKKTCKLPDYATEFDVKHVGIDDVVK